MLVRALDLLSPIAAQKSVVALRDVRHNEQTEHAFAQLPYVVLDIIEQLVNLLYKAYDLLLLNNWLEIDLAVHDEIGEYAIHATHLAINALV